MRTIAIAAAIIGVAAIVLGLILDVLWWLIVAGLVVLAAGLAAGWVGTRHATHVHHRHRAG